MRRALAERRRRLALLLPESMARNVEPVCPVGIGMPMWRRVGRIDLKSARLAWLPASHRGCDAHPVVVLEVSQGELESDAFSDALFVHYGPPSSSVSKPDNADNTGHLK